MNKETKTKRELLAEHIEFCKSIEARCVACRHALAEQEAEINVLQRKAYNMLVKLQEKLQILDLMQSASNDDVEKGEDNAASDE